MTEEDTFKTLKRIPFDSLISMIGDLPAKEFEELDESIPAIGESSPLFDQFLAKYGWTFGDFNNYRLDLKND